MSIELCQCGSCSQKGCNVVTKEEHDMKVLELSNRIADLENDLERANGILDTLKHVVNYILENA